MKKYGILGIARSGIAAAKKIKQFGEKVFLSDSKPESNFDKKIIQDLECEFRGHSEKILDCDIIIVSPGIPLDIPILQKAKERKIELISEIEFGYRIKSPDSKIIAITGSNGKIQLSVLSIIF